MNNATLQERLQEIRGMLGGFSRGGEPPQGDDVPQWCVDAAVEIMAMNYPSGDAVTNVADIIAKRSPKIPTPDSLKLAFLVASKIDLLVLELRTPQPPPPKRPKKKASVFSKWANRISLKKLFNL